MSDKRGYAELRRDWMNLLSGGDDMHTIWRQFADLCSDHLAFRVMRMAMSRLEYRKIPSPLRNPLLTDMFFQGYFVREVLAVRRLVDPPQKNPDKQVISLRRLVIEVESAATIITRRAFVTFNDAPYDPTEGERAWLQHLGRLVESRGSKATMSWGGPKAHGFPDFYASRRRHMAFDRLAGVQPGARAENDTIESEVFRVLKRCRDSDAVHRVRRLADKRGSCGRPSLPVGAWR